MRRFILLTEIHRLQALLLEGRVDVLRSKYHDQLLAILPKLHIPQVERQKYGLDGDTGVHADVLFDRVLDADPDPQKKNTQWLLNLLVSGRLPYEDLEKAPDYLSKWMEKKKKKELPPEAMDLGRFKSLGDLFTAISDSDKAIVSAKDAEFDAAYQASTILLDNDHYLIAVPHSEAAAQYWGRNTEWCTAWGDPKGRHPKRNCQYQNYNSRGPLYVIIDKLTDEMWQFHFEEKQFMNVNDRQINLGQFIIEHPTVIQVIGEEHLLPLIGKHGITEHSISSDFFSKSVFENDDKLTIWKWKSAVGFRAKPKGKVNIFFINYRDGVISSLCDQDAFADPELAKYVLNVIGLPPSVEIGNSLKTKYVYYNEGRYGSYTDVGTVVYSDDAFKAYQVNDTVFVKNESDGVLKDYTSMRLTFYGKILSDIDYNDAQLTEDRIIKILNTLGFLTDTHTNHQLSGFDIFRNDVKFGTLDEVGVKEGTFNYGGEKIELFRLGKRPAWVMRMVRKTVNSKSHTSYEFVYMKQRRITMGDESPPRYKKPIRYLVDKYGAISIPENQRYGIIFPNDKKAKPVLSIRDFVANLGILQEYGSPFGISKESTAFLKTFIHDVDYTSSEVKSLIKAMRPDSKKSFLVNITDTSKVYDLEVHQYEINLPEANIEICKLFDIPFPKTVEADMVRAITQATAYVDNLKYGKIVFTDDLEYRPEWYIGADRSKEIDQAYDKLVTAIRRLDARTRDAISERFANPDKYATDLSSRFAALLAKRKSR